MNDSPNDPATKPEASRRIWVTVVLLVVCVVAALPILDQRAAHNYDTLFQRAIVTFALARTLNGVISAAQGTEVALQPAGVGVTLTPGQILDPVNDLVERFSWIMLGATISLGVQSVLLEISAWWVLQGLVIVLALALIVLRWKGRARSPARAILWRVLWITLFLRFAVPLTLVANEAIYELFLEARYTQSTEVIKTAGEELQVLEDEQVAELEETESSGAMGGVFDALGAAWEGATTGGGMTAQLQAIQARAASVIEHLIQLSVVFILQTGILPLVFLWLFLQLSKWLMRPVVTRQDD